MLRDNFKCECRMCLDKVQVEPGIYFPEISTLQIGLKPALMAVSEFRQLSLDTIEEYERKAIEFLQQYDQYHPNGASLLLQRAWIVIWNLLVTRFEGVPLRIDNSQKDNSN